MTHRYRNAKAALLTVWLPVLAVLVLCIALNQWALRYPMRADLTAAGLYSISPETKKVLDRIREPVRITYFYDLKHRTMQDGKALLRQYGDRNPLLEIEVVDPSMQPSVARRHGVMFPGTTVMETASRRITVQGGSETDFTNGLLRVTSAHRQSLCFTEGHGELDPFSLTADDHAEHLAGPGTGGRDDGFGRALQIHERNGMAMARQAAETLGFGVRKLSLARDALSRAECGVVVVAGPRVAFAESEAARLSAYLDEGGKLLALLEPAAHGLDQLLARYGVVHERAPVRDPARHYGTDEGSPAVSAYPGHAVTRDLVMTFFPGAASLRPAEAPPADVRLTPLIQTSASATVLEDARTKTAAQPAGKRTIGVLAKRNVPGSGGSSSDGEPLPRKAELLVIANAAFASNMHFAAMGNGNLFLNAVGYLASQQDLLDIAPRNYELPQVRMSNGQMRFTFLFSTVLAPLLALAFGLAVWWRRRG